MNIECYPQPKTCDIANLCEGEIGYWEEEEKMIMSCSTWGTVPLQEKMDCCICIDLERGTLYYVPIGTQIIPMDVKLVLNE